MFSPGVFVFVCMCLSLFHDDVSKWKNFPRYWPFVLIIHRWSVNSPHKGQWRGAFMFPLIGARTNSWANNGDVGDLKRHRAHYDVIVMYHGVCSDGLITKDWCHTNNILQVHNWRCLFVQVFNALVTSSMTSPGHKVGQILKSIYFRQYFS